MRLMFDASTVAAVYDRRRCERIGIVARIIPLLASQQGGVAASSKKCCEATEDAAGVVFLCVLNRKTTPASLSADASRYFINRSATPPCGDARRGMRSIPTVCLLVLALLALPSCRQNMANGPRYSTFQESGFFSNASSARPLPPGTVPQERERNIHLVKGTVDGQPASAFPFPVTLEVLQRGRQRFDIFCTPCHDHLGTGQGMAVRRGFRQAPPSFHIDRLRAAPPGYFFNVITNGFGVMPSYASQIPARDRWAIIAYVRALELSWSTTAADVPPDELKRLEAAKQ